MEPRVLAVLDTTPIVSLSEGKLHAKVQESADDTLMGKYIEAATCACEKWCGLYFRQKRVEWSFVPRPYRYGQTDCRPIQLPYGPNQIIESVTQVDSSDVETVLTTDQYSKSGYSFLGILPERRSSLSHYGVADGYMKVVYKAGYHMTDDDEALIWPLEEDIIQAVRLLASELYENRQVSVTGTIVATLDVTHKTLLAPYRRNPMF